MWRKIGCTLWSIETRPPSLLFFSSDDAPVEPGFVCQNCFIASAYGRSAMCARTRRKGEDPHERRMTHFNLEIAATILVCTIAGSEAWQSGAMKVSCRRHVRFWPCQDGNWFKYVHRLSWCSDFIFLCGDMFSIKSIFLWCSASDMSERIPMNETQ